MKIVPIISSDDYGCSPCWENGRDVNATVCVEDIMPVGWPKHTYMCGNHADVLVAQITDTSTEEDKCD